MGDKNKAAFHNTTLMGSEFDSLKGDHCNRKSVSMTHTRTDEKEMEFYQKYCRRPTPYSIYGPAVKLHLVNSS